MNNIDWVLLYKKKHISQILKQLNSSLPNYLTLWCTQWIGEQKKKKKRFTNI